MSADHGGGPPPAVVLMQIVQGFMVAKALQAAAVLGIADLLHDWSDEKSLDILRVCRRAMGPGSRLIIVDAVMEAGDAPHPAKWFDLHMMLALGGRERTEDEFRALLNASGFALRSAIPLPAPIDVVEAEPI